MDDIANIKRKNEIIFSDGSESSIIDNLAKIRHEINNQLTFLVSNNEVLSSYINKLMKYVESVNDFKELYKKDVSASELNRQFRLTEEIREKCNIDNIMQDIISILSDERIGFDRIKHTTDSTKTFFKEAILKETGQYGDINESIENCINTVRYSSEHIGFKTRFEKIPKVKFIKTQYERAIINLLINSIDAIDKKNIPNGEITITTYTSNKKVVCEIMDNGVGISAKNKGKIFEERYTTKSNSLNSGFGLPIAKEIIEINHDGNLTCESIEGIGSKFSIMLPLD